MKYCVAFVCLAALSLGCQRKSLESELAAEGLQIYSPQQIEALLESQKVDLATRLAEVQSLQLAFKNSYIGYNLKKQLIGQSGDEIFQSCQDSEKQNPEKSYNYEFYTRLRQCLADFQDGHIYLKKTANPLQVLSVIQETLWINGKWTISRTRPQILDKLFSTGGMTQVEKLALVPGTEILEIDGLPADQALANYEKYISASSRLGRRTEAALSYFVRHLDYPAAPTSIVTLLTSQKQTVKVQIPWFTFAPRKQDYLETPNILKKRGIGPRAEFEASRELWQSKGLATSQPVFFDFTEKYVYQYQDDDVLRMGIAKTEKQSICYLQLLSFDLDPDVDGNYLVAKVGDSSSTFNILTEIESFLSACNQKKFQMIVDLRENGGGDSVLAEKFAGFFDPSSAPTIFYASALASRAGNFSFLQNVKISNTETKFLDELYANAWMSAFQNSEEITPWILKRTATLKTGVFNQPLKVLTGPLCYSACENTVARFKQTQRGQIIGQPTHGTGFGYKSFGGTETKWRSSYNEFEVKIPNHAFQSIYPSANLMTDGSAQGELVDFHKVPTLENHPTQPDVVYEIQLSDLTDYQGYREFLSNLLDGQTAESSK